MTSDDKKTEQIYWTTRDVNRICRGGSDLYYPHPEFGGTARVLRARTKDGITQLRLLAFGSSKWYDASFSKIERR